MINYMQKKKIFNSTIYIFVFNWLNVEILDYILNVILIEFFRE